MSADAAGFLGTLLEEIFRDGHRYAPGVDQNRSANVAADAGAVSRRGALRERGRDLLERAAARAGFSHRHFEPRGAAQRLAGIIAISEGLERTYNGLCDESSRRALIDLMKLRVLGPHHAPLEITPEAYRAKQDYVDSQLRLQRGTFEVADPWFSPLSLYRVTHGGSEPITLHSHSVDIVSMFLLEQYSYLRDRESVGAMPGDVVLDVGGCWGETALYFARRVGPDGKVYTFEFNPESLEVLRANLALNPKLADRVEVVERALWDGSGETLAYVGAGAATAILPGEAEADRPRVLTVTVDDFVAEARIDRLDFIKLDVEGAENSVLAGARGSIERFRPELAVAAYHRDDDLVKIPAAILSSGSPYQTYLRTSSPLEDETVLFATCANSST